MFYNIYSIYDRKAGMFGAPFLSHNDATASRQFNYQMSQAQMVAQDCELYALGVFDSNSGQIDVTEFKPRFVVAFGQEVKE